MSTPSSPDCTLVVDGGWAVADAADAAAVSERCCYTWLSRWRAGEPMTDKSSAPDEVVNRQALLPWLRYYNGVRPHGSLAKRTPLSQIG